MDFMWVGNFYFTLWQRKYKRSVGNKHITNTSTTWFKIRSLYWLMIIFFLVCLACLESSETLPSGQSHHHQDHYHHPSYYNEYYLNKSWHHLYLFYLNQLFFIIHLSLPPCTFVEACKAARYSLLSLSCSETTSLSLSSSSVSALLFFFRPFLFRDKGEPGLR